MGDIQFVNFKEKRVLFIPDSCDKFSEYFDSNKDAILIIDFYELVNFPNFNNFDCLIDAKIEKLLIVGSKRQEYDFSRLLKMPELIFLDNRGVDMEYDFVNFPNLEILRYSWNKKCKNISTLKKVKELSLWKYRSKSDDLEEFASMNSIMEIGFIQSDIKSINGIEKMINLKELVLVSNKNLSFNNFDFIMPNVESLYIEDCKKIDKSFVRIFPNLKRVEFINHSSIDSLQNILENLKSLEYLNLGETTVLETDNRYWKNYNYVKINFIDQKHYILKRKDFE
ncbi:hypothetical protein [Flavobacterium cerinum]|uniref:Leucine-rich repeat domain-containing protein n=1 Tax=Flavobacterium cerinum TaxID=2502784 RepID=A0ABY5IUJ7_9FLAO|nr:hypothetical protein [Flavobacterium cerinum]UUC46497.1 hypothetical protein NOX80_04675 [Flavobacterium cerinum]